MALPSKTGFTALSKTLVLNHGHGELRPGFELRFLRGRRSARRALNTLQEVREMGIEEQAKGKLDEAKGRTEQAQGDLTGDDAKKGEGMLDEAKGKGRQAADNVKDAVHDLTK
jgi:uncharacterized protein YjbJ (UPF0337 family)